MMSGKPLTDSARNVGYIDDFSNHQSSQQNNETTDTIRGYIGYQLTLDALVLNTTTAEIEAAKTLEANNIAHQHKINAILERHGFTDRIDIKRGITATIAVFKYHGNDVKVQALERSGYVVVKIPPYPVATNKHAQETYENELKIIEEIAHIKAATRPLLLVLRMGGISFILNSPIYFDEEAFCVMRDANLEEYQLISTNPASALDCKYEFEEFVREQFHNLSSYMTLLASKTINPEPIFDLFFCSMLNALIDLHKDGILHLDIACRNIVVQRTGAALLVDFGMAAIIFKVNACSRTNHKFPNVSLMHNFDALRAEKYIIDVITDYVSLQKTMLEAIAIYIGVDFYRMCMQGLDDAPSLKGSSTQIFAQHKDETVINNAIMNLKKAAKTMAARKIVNGKYALTLIDKYTPFFTHVHNRKHGYEQLRDDYVAKFYECTRHVHTVMPRDAITKAVGDYDKRLNQQTTAVSKHVADVPTGTVSEAIRKFGAIVERKQASSKEGLAKPRFF